MFRSLSLALAATSGSFAVASEDASALLQVGTATQKADPCRCMVWADVYSKHEVVCGMANELGFLPHPERHPAKIQEICSRFFEKFTDRHCVQTLPSEPVQDQWCYVSEECQELDDGVHMEGSDVSWKHCSPEKDAQLSTLTPEELHKIAVKTGTDPSLLLRLAYPLWMQTNPDDYMYWPGAQMVLGLIPPYGNLTRKNQTVHKIMATNQPYVLNSLTGKPPYGLIWGEKVYEAKYSQYFWNNVAHIEEVYDDLPGVIDYVCRAGCKK